MRSIPPSPARLPPFPPLPFHQLPHSADGYYEHADFLVYEFWVNVVKTDRFCIEIDIQNVNASFIPDTDATDGSVPESSETE